ncbi:MAG TPA: hydrogenase maturation nickel metallochaperone HypA [Streptosporangiaceae bacterium]|nr:hydrogenase maturation nickel metallochaperone HypA [Streptosporangiaceae bacterium]
MHELAIAEGLVDGVTERLPGRRIASVRVEIGTLSGVVPDALRFCFGMATEGTPLAGADLEISEPEAKCDCGDCGRSFEPEDSRILLCPCGSANVTVVSGQQLLITSVKVA